MFLGKLRQQEGGNVEWKAGNTGKCAERGFTTGPPFVRWKMISARPTLQRRGNEGEKRGRGEAEILVRRTPK